MARSVQSYLACRGAGGPGLAREARANGGLVPLDSVEAEIAPVAFLDHPRRHGENRARTGRQQNTKALATGRGRGVRDTTATPGEEQLVTEPITAVSKRRAANLGPRPNHPHRQPCSASPEPGRQRIGVRCRRGGTRGGEGEEGNGYDSDSESRVTLQPEAFHFPSFGSGTVL